jgi:spermidine/putrescine ABC transporter ATP-binding subunit
MTNHPNMLLSLRSVEITYGNVLALRASSFEVNEGEFVTLLGPSGSGKTSLLRAIAGFLKPSAGTIHLRGVSIAGVPTYKRNIGMVFQNYALFPHLNVEQNIAFGLEMRKVKKSEIRSRIASALQYVQLENLEKRRIHELSGGQQQRIAIARALAIQPDLLLLDEPMSNLDAQLRTSMQGELRALLHDAGVTAIYVTHNQEEALSMSDRIVVMANGEIRQIGTPSEIYNHPSDTFVAKFVGQSNIFKASATSAASGRVTAQAEWGGGIEFISTRTLPQSFSAMVRPERIRIQASGGAASTNTAEGEITNISYLGNHQLIKVAVSGYSFIVVQPAGYKEVSAATGQHVMLSWPADAVVPVRQI